MDYPLHQYRLLPRMGEAIHFYLGATRMSKIWIDNLPKLYDEKNRRNELCHGLSASMKAYSSWFQAQTLSECRQALGGLGFSHYACIGSIMNNGDVN